tara:strand:+ start:97 stop:684 length:588 start_codon:yes stop_codon:yes gene_type:complete
MNMNDNGVSGSSLSLLGQTRVAPPINTQRPVDGLGDAISATSSTAVVSSEGMVFTGIVTPEGSNRFTQTHSITVKVPDDVADEIISVSATYSFGAIGSTAELTAKATVVGTTNSATRTFQLSGGADRRDVTIFGATTLTGAGIKGNSIDIELKRTPGSGNDDGSFSSLVIHDIKVNFQRFSVKAINTQSLGFTPY